MPHWLELNLKIISASSPTFFFSFTFNLFDTIYLMFSLSLLFCMNFITFLLQGIFTFHWSQIYYNKNFHKNHLFYFLYYLICNYIASLILNIGNLWFLIFSLILADFQFYWFLRDISFDSIDIFYFLFYWFFHDFKYFRSSDHFKFNLLFFFFSFHGASWGHWFETFLHINV